jgi:hypothetical protein
MKWLLSLFISVFLLNHGKLSASASYSSEEAGIQYFDCSLGAEKECGDLFNIPSQFKHYASNSASDNQHPHKGKKKNKKGVKPVYCCLPVDCIVFSFVSDRDTIFSKKEFDTICSFFGNGKRGPPYLLV